MTPTADGKGLLLSYWDSVYTFNCHKGGVGMLDYCSFTPTGIKLKERSHNPIMLTVPSSLLSEC